MIKCGRLTQGSIITNNQDDESYLSVLLFQMEVTEDFETFWEVQFEFLVHFVVPLALIKLGLLQRDVVQCGAVRRV